MKRGITEYLERFRSIWKNKDRCGSELLLEEIKAFLTLRRPKELLVFLEEICKRLGDLGEILNKAAVTCQTEETSHLLDILRRKPFNDRLDGFRIDSNAFSRNDMAKIDDLRKPKFTFGELGIETVFTKLQEDEAKMLFMLLIGLGLDKDIIKIDYHKLVEVLHENVVHQPRESGRSISEAKGHDGVFVETITSFEGCLGYILLADFDLVITTSQIHLREHSCTRKLIKEFIDARKRICILDRFLIERTVVNHQSISFILFLDEDGRTSPWRSAWLNETKFLQLVKLLLEFSQLIWTHFVWPL
jgi:DNA-directed RNA polymerase subunit F